MSTAPGFTLLSGAGTRDDLSIPATISPAISSMPGPTPLPVPLPLPLPLILPRVLIPLLVLPAVKLAAAELPLRLTGVTLTPSGETGGYEDVVGNAGSGGVSSYRCC